MVKKINFEENVYTAGDVGRLAKQYIDERVSLASSGKSGRIEFGLPYANEYLNPFMGGDLVCTLGRPAQGKSLLTNWLFDNQLKRLSKHRPPNEVGILITTEVTVERAALYWMARMANVSMRQAIRGELDTIEIKRFGLAAVRLSTYPMFIIGHSSKRSETGRRARPNLTIDNLTGAIDYIINTYKDPETDRHIDPQIIVLDYLQRLSMPKSARGDRAEANLIAVDWAKNTGIWTGAPFFLNVQAGRNVDTREIRIPQMDDAQWTSNVEQSADFMFGVWIPHQTGHHTLKPISNLPAMKTDENLMLVGVLKQKDGPSGNVLALYIEPDKLLIRER